MIAGDSLHERKIGHAPGFPIRQLKRHEAITTNDVMNVLGAKIGDEISVSVSITNGLSSNARVFGLNLVRLFPNDLL